MKLEITKKGIRNPKALWQWIKRECEAGNIEDVTCETLLGEVSYENCVFLTYPKGRIITITLGMNDHKELTIANLEKAGKL